MKHIGFLVKIENNTQMANIVKTIYAFIVHIYGYFNDSFHYASNSILVYNNNNNNNNNQMNTLACIFNTRNSVINT